MNTLNTQYFSADYMYMRIQWLMIIRLIVVTLTLLIGYFFINIPIDAFYDLIAFYYLISILYIVLLQRSKHYYFLGFFQIAIDLIAVTSIVSYTGPVDSVFPSLYTIIIFLSIIVFPKYGGIITAIASIILYISTVLFLFLNYSYEYIDIVGGSKVALYVAYIYITIFAAVGYLSHYISNILQQTSYELEQITRKSNFVFKHINTGLLIIKPNDIITYVNDAALSLFNLKNEEVCGMPWQLLFNFENSNIDINNIFNLKNEIELQLIQKNNNDKTIPVAASFSTINISSNKSSLKIILFRDIRQQKINEQKLLEAERLKAIANLSSTVAHEIGNPLAAISGSAELLLATIKNAEQKKLLQIILSEIERLSDIVNDFLSFTRLRTIEYSKLDLNNLIMDIVVLLHHSKKNTDNMKFIFTELPEPLYIFADEKQLKQALLNIGLNALDAMPNGGKLSFSITPNENDKSVQIAISDTGVGIPKKILNNIFNSFFTTKKNGSGIGLYVTQKIIQSHRGSIKVKSSPETGTTFYITLPTNID